MKIDNNNFLAKPDKTGYEHECDIIKQIDILYNLGYINNKQRNFLYFIAKYHDFGKCNKYFKKRIVGEVSKFDEENEVPHNILSIYFIDRDDFENIAEYYLCMYVILNHHNYVDNFEYISNIDNHEKIDKLLEPYGYEVADITRKILKKLKDIGNDEETIILTGLFRRCDCIASAGKFDIEYKNDFLTESLYHWKDSLGINFRALQVYAEENTNNNCITIAQTGMGKTEAALLWIGNHKGFFFLPLKTANNAIYERVKGLVSEDECDYSFRVGLLHSDSILYYVNNNRKYDNNDLDIVEYYDKTKSLVLPITISTLDQLFPYVYLYPGYENKLATLSYSKIVIDEIQSYDAKIMAALIIGLKKASKLGAKIHILTATLPPYIRDLLVSPDKDGYSIDFKFNKFIDDTVLRHNVKVIDNSLNAKDVYMGYQKHKGKTLVICNTVKKAQSLYKSLKNMGIENVKLLHSKFIMNDRNIKESDILRCGATAHKEDIIWISTQIVEASLDIDFDYLYTEMSDLASLLQRLGRENRKGLKPVDCYNCFIYLKIDKNLIDRLVDNAIYELSCEAMRTVDGLFLESKKEKLIEEYLTTEKLKQKSSKFIRDYKSEEEFINGLKNGDLSKNESKLRDIENITFIPKIVYENNKNIIEKAEDDFKNAKTCQDKIKSRDIIRGFTVSVPAYDKIKLGKVKHVIQLSAYEFINIYDCSYDFGNGIIYNTNN